MLIKTVFLILIFIAMLFKMLLTLGLRLLDLHLLWKNLLGKVYGMPTVLKSLRQAYFTENIAHLIGEWVKKCVKNIFDWL